MVLLRKNHSSLLITSGDSVILYDLKNQEGTHLKIPEPVLPENLTKGQIEVLKKEIRNVTSFDFSKENNYLVVSTENKQVVVYDKQFNIVKNFIVSRAASKVRFTPSNDILVADKTGDVYLYRLNEEKTQPQLLLGHLSVILDMLLSECGKYIITCDRDEKIRVSCFPNAYNIVSFCLGHREFVTSIKLVKNILVSASGDGTVRFWNYIEGRQLGIINTNDHINESNLLDTFARQMDKEKVDVVALPVTNLQVQCDSNKMFVVVSIYNFTALQVYKTDVSNFNSVYIMTIDVSRGHFSFCLSSELYIFSDRFLVYKLANEVFEETSVPCLEKFNERYKEILKLDEDNDIIMLYKRKFDNVQEYLERKRQRLEAK